MPQSIADVPFHYGLGHYIHMDELKYTNQVPGADEFVELRDVAGLSKNTLDAASKGLAGTCFSVCVRDNESLVGMGRVIGDGGCFFQIVDIAVHPEFQRRGVGFKILSLCPYFSFSPATVSPSLVAFQGSRRARRRCEQS